MSRIGLHSAYMAFTGPQPQVGQQAGPLAGLTVAIKDMFDIAGERVSGGSPAWLDFHAPAKNNSAVVDRLLCAGAEIVGKTICDEFFYSVTGTNHHFGVPINPRASGCIPGGSSSGSASAASSGSCDFSIGSDTGGSVRVPASLCGVYGIRVSHGRIDLKGAMPMAPSFDACGWFSAVPGVFSRVGQVLLEGFRHDVEPINRFRLATDMFEIADPAVSDLCSGFVEALSSRLNLSESVEIAGRDIDNWRDNFRIVQAFEVWKTFGSFVEQAKPLLGPGIHERMRDAKAITPEAAEEGRNALAAIREKMEALTANNTVLIFPTCPATAPSVQSSPEELNEFRTRTMRMVCAASISGLPQVTLPIGTTSGSPVGLSFLGWRGSDEELLALARSLSRHVGVTS